MTSQKKLIKLIILTVLLGGVILAGIIGFMSLMEGADPEVAAKKDEAYKQQTGYYTRIKEISNLTGLSEFDSKVIISKLMKETGVDKFDRVSKSAQSSVFDFAYNEYTFNVMLRASDVVYIKIGSALIYQLETEGSKGVVLQDKKYSFSEYDKIVSNLAKDLKIEKKSAASMYKVMTQAGIIYFTDVTKIKSDNETIRKYKGMNGTMPLVITLSGESISEIDIVVEDLNIDINVYSKSKENTPVLNPKTGKPTGEIVGQHIRKYIPLLGERTSLPTALVYQMEKALGEGKKVQLPVTLPTGEDAWFIVRTSENEMFLRVTGNITEGSKTKNKDFELKRNTESGVITYLKVDGKVILGGK